MDTVELNSFKALFIAGRHRELIRLADEEIRMHPERLEGYYYAGLSYVCLGSVEKGLGYLSGLLELFQKDPAAILVDAPKSLLVGYTALQCSQLADGYEFRAFAHTYGALYARIAVMIGTQFHCSELRDAALQVLECYKPWRKMLADGRVAGGMCFIPRSPFVLQVEPTNCCNL